MEYPASRLPALLKHMTLAIFKKKKGQEKQRFLEAFEIARHQLVQYGYLTAVSKSGPLKMIKLTGKGIKKSAEHDRESAAKERAFAQLYEQYRASLEVQESEEE
jgi:hypothetical protein